MIILYCVLGWVLAGVVGTLLMLLGEYIGDNSNTGWVRELTIGDILSFCGIGVIISPFMFVFGIVSCFMEVMGYLIDKIDAILSKTFGANYEKFLDRKLFK
jgi:hypothetical protein